MSIATIRRAAPGIGIDMWSMGWPKFAARGREAGVRFSERLCGACVARGIASAGRGVRELWMQESTAAENVRWRLRVPNPLVLTVFLATRIERPSVENARRRQVTSYPLVSSEARRGSAWAVDSRERSTEAGNTLPLCLAEGSVCSRKRSRLGIADSADRDAGWRAEWSLVKKILFLYCKIHVFESFRRRSVLFVIGFSHATRIMRSGDIGEITIDDVRVLSGALVSSPNFGAAKRYFERTAP